MRIKSVQTFETNALGSTAWACIAQTTSLAFMALAAIAHAFARTRTANAFGLEVSGITDSKWSIAHMY